MSGINRGGPRDRPSEGKAIQTNSIISDRTKRGMVNVFWDEKKAQFDPEDARRFAHTLMREADNAETDAQLFGLFTQKLNLTDAHAYRILYEFRLARARREQNAGLRPQENFDKEGAGR